MYKEKMERAHCPTPFQLTGELIMVRLSLRSLWLLSTLLGPVCSCAQWSLPEWQEDRDHGQLPAQAPLHERVVEAALW